MKTYAFQVGTVSTVPRLLTEERAKAEAQRIADRTSQRVTIFADGKTAGSVSPSWSGAAA